MAVIAACAAVDVFYNAQANLPKLCRTSVAECEGSLHAARLD